MQNEFDLIICIFIDLGSVKGQRSIFGLSSIFLLLVQPGLYKSPRLYFSPRLGSIGESMIFKVFNN